MVARIGGDEFAVAAGDLPHAQAALALATRLEAALHDPFEVAGISVSVRPSIGIALGPDDGQTADELLQHADVAMYVAKRSGAVRKLYSRSLDHYSPDRLALAGELRDAIARADGDVHLAFQPKLDLLTDEIPGVECLVRWKHPERGFVPPAEFLPIIENTELIAPLTWLVLDQALATCASWRRHGLELQVAVNISARTIGQPELYDRVVATLGRYELPPSALELELTESALLGDQHDAAANVSRLRELGVSISIDDFGTGYASVGYLTTMPISGLKVDRSFVERMFDDDASSAVIDFSVGLGRQLGLQIVAEGVEDERTLEELRRRGCHAAQGYFISRPMGANEFLHWLLAWSTRHLSPRDIIGAAGRDVPRDPTPTDDGGIIGDLDLDLDLDLVGGAGLSDAGASPASPYVTSAHRTSPYATGPFRSGVAAMDTDAGHAGDTESSDPGDVWDAAGPYELAGVASTPWLSGAGTVTTVLPLVTPTPGPTTPGQAPTALHTVEPVSALSPVPPLTSVPTLSPVPALSPAPATASSVPTAVAPRFSLRLPPPSVEGPGGGSQPPSVEGER